MATVAASPDARTVRVPARMQEAAHAADLARDILDDAVAALCDQLGRKNNTTGRRDELLDAIRLFKLCRSHLANARNHVAAGVSA